MAIICKLCGETLRDGFDGYSTLWCEHGKGEHGELVLWVHCERCLSQEEDNDDGDL